jgi:hypothetical protein
MQISRRTFFILIGIIVLLALGGLGWFILKQSGGTQTSGENTPIRDFFPFGKPAETRTDQQPTSTNTPTQTPGTTEAVTPVTDQRLRKVWQGAVAGYFAFQKDVPISPLTAGKTPEKTITPTYTLTKTLSSGSKDAEVKELEKILNACPETQVATTGVGSPGKEGTQFTAKTKAALVKFQEKFPEELLQPLNRTTGNGILDTLTRAKINKPWSCTLTGAAATEKRAVVRFVEKGNGNIHDAYANTLETKRLTNTTVPRVAEAFFVNNGSQVLLRYLRDDTQTVDTYLGTLPKENWGQNPAAGTLTGEFLEPNISDISVSPDTKRIFSMSSLGGVIIGSVGNPDGSDRKQIFTSPFTGWLSSWPNGKDIILTVKATGYAPGYAFKLNAGDKNPTPEKILGPTIGLTTLPSYSMQSILFSRNTAEGPRIALFDTKTAKIRDLAVNTLPEKCIWAKDDSSIFCAVPSFIPKDLVMPDSWYQGEIAFSDTLIKIDKEGILPARTLIDPGNQGEKIDAIRLQLSDDGSMLYFINKRDDTLWQLKI